MTAGDIAYLVSMALATVIDLRSEAEIDENPDLLPDGVEWINYSLNTDFDFESVLEKIIAGEVDAYETMLDFFQPISMNPVSRPGLKFSM